MTMHRGSYQLPIGPLRVNILYLHYRQKHPSVRLWVPVTIHLSSLEQCKFATEPLETMLRSLNKTLAERVSVFGTATVEQGQRQARCF